MKMSTTRLYPMSTTKLSKPNKKRYSRQSERHAERHKSGVQCASGNADTQERQWPHERRPFKVILLQGSQVADSSSAQMDHRSHITIAESTDGTPTSGLGSSTAAGHVGPHCMFRRDICVMYRVMM